MSHIGREYHVQVDGKTYTLSRWTKQLADEFALWAQQYIPNPVKALKEWIHDFDDFPDVQKEMIKEARQEATAVLNFSSAKVQEVLNSYEGMLKFYEMLLKVKHPEITEDECQDVVVKLLNQVERTCVKCNKILSQEEYDKINEEKEKKCPHCGRDFRPFSVSDRLLT